ncbi:MAG: CRISPR-associated protein Cse2 (CRISPR_cse2) [Euryarchaeota archaeon ADurb.Bin009]|jgi:CRISPR system Cascade subunit CasB|uniref:type I-E CRISPR-associated protein Cse2/CasB n=1 Tax=Methanoculleus sp. TaxID=90427 RepID=UPI0009C60E5A|nr:type I-E CRISPR-associated protein Cse2/CasB [Methanoculleus sp.]OQC71604.1 MAG: CRISPR-associated protein Cse2 (CRISPR_cse2) [Euryarchaeota archaeon ADurb.Bin009]MBP7145325.1 type I-E CRISPR-associated protein Cse2/CasB [Methanoculleus sp.]HNQ33367.1 type I-E CRISPR-associated protein Cse2/CasB [Methanoculleus sp.]HNT07878.1 type I-E CRISPR-associated protein Cse2/CasB [Methanoculleus sp.]HNV37724.1 type I-E CRISPR-associated protein Cse2/CasB [Methanoculleus sp.]
MKQMNYISFTNNPDARSALVEWWGGLERARGDRAALRRCRSAQEIAFVPAFHRLRHDLSRIAPVDAEKLAVVAGILSHVRKNDYSLRFAQQMATSKDGGDRARVSGLRFRRLLKIEGRDDLYGAIVRIVRLLDGSVNIASLADGVYWWNERTKNNWAFDYYDRAPEES